VRNLAGLQITVNIALCGTGDLDVRDRSSAVLPVKSNVPLAQRCKS
jgi:hypothetical protein